MATIALFTHREHFDLQSSKGFMPFNIFYMGDDHMMSGHGERTSRTKVVLRLEPETRASNLVVGFCSGTWMVFHGF